MNLREISIKRAYDSDIDNVLLDFYVPALSASVRYSRLSGFFSSTSLAVAAKGISGLIRNGGTVRLVTGARFREEDVGVIREAYENPQNLLEKQMLGELDKLEDEFVKDHVRALGWMIANKRLRIKIAIVFGEDDFPIDSKNVEKRGIFHQKVGILEDLEDNQLSFSGSDNESAHGWENNVEEFKVFRSWIEEEKEYLNADLMKFDRFWQGEAKRTKIVDMPEAIEEKLIEIAPKDFDELDLEKWVRGKRQEKPFELRGYQKEAVKNWFSNGKKGIFEMATGSGKTITALSCLQKIREEEHQLVAVVSSPFIHLSEQWIRELGKLEISCDKLIADSSSGNWKDKLADALLDVENGVNDHQLVFTTHNTFSSDDFMKMIKDSKKRLPKTRFFVIVDEVHGIGAPERRRGLIGEYDYRLGLSATPKRWFDLQGTDKIFGYFGDVVFQFTLKDAIDAGYLTPYIYMPHFAVLSEEEMSRYETETRKISRAYYSSKDEEEQDEIFTLLCIKRQKIIRNAMNKLEVFDKILDELGEVKYCLVYCSPQQIRTVQSTLNARNIIQHKFTEREGTRQEEKFGWISERDFLIKQFSEGTYRALVSMRCLDEGVDVPPARTAIMLDNSGNPREYIQRRGRVLRKFPGKDNAIIHDIIVEPSLRAIGTQELGELERKIVVKELERYRDFARSAQNAEECLRTMEDVEAMYGI